MMAENGPDAPAFSLNPTRTDLLMAEKWESILVADAEVAVFTVSFRTYLYGHDISLSCFRHRARVLPILSNHALQRL